MSREKNEAEMEGSTCTAMTLTTYGGSAAHMNVEQSMSLNAEGGVPTASFRSEGTGEEADSKDPGDFHGEEKSHPSGQGHLVRHHSQSRSLPNMESSFGTRDSL